MSAPSASSCPNCDTPYAGPRPRYCPACGQETRVQPPTLAEFAQQFAGAYVSTEGALWRTLKLLLLKPGALTAEYLAGRRRRYVLPLRLYLTTSVLVLLLVRALASSALDAVPAAPAAAPAQPQQIALDFGGGRRAGLRDGRFYCEQLPQWACRRLERRLAVDAKALLREVRALGERFVGNLGAAMFLLVPAFAAGLKLAYLNRRLRYTEHLVFALHVHAFWFVGFAAMLLPWSGSDLAATAAMPLYTLLAMRRVYGGRWGPRLARAAFVAVLYGLTLGLALAAVGVWSLLF